MVINQYDIRETNALANTRDFPRVPFPEVGCLDAPEYLPLGGHEGWQSQYTEGVRIITGLGVPR